jgi:hypothetical protein
MTDCDRCLVKDNLAAQVGKRTQTNEDMGERWHDMSNIVARGSVETKAIVALATGRLGHPFATVTLTVGAHGF